MSDLSSMLPRTTTEIDLDVHRAIEARRTSFEQSQNDILRKILNLDGSAGQFAAGTAAISPSKPVRRVVKNRRTGSYRFTLFGKPYEEQSLKGAYKKCLVRLSWYDPNFLENLSQKKTSARRYVARKPHDLFFKSPRLAEDFAERLEGPWWIDVNLSQDQVESRLKTACKIAGLTFGKDLKLDFPL